MPDGDRIHEGGEPVKTQTAGAKLEKQFVFLEISTEAPTRCAGVRDTRHREGRYYLWDAEKGSRNEDRRNWQEAEIGTVDRKMESEAPTWKLRRGPPATVVNDMRMMPGCQQSKVQ